MLQSELLGFIAGTFTTLAFIPQVLKTYRTKSARDVSIMMFVLFSAGVLMWMAFGIVHGKMSIFITNLVVFCLSVFQIILKIRYDKNEKENKKG